jgi:uncharacterized protein YndB with AHSA1/START domain
MTATTTPPNEPVLILKREFPAPRQKVFETWTQPEHLKRWFPPGDGYDNPVVEIDLRVGGRYRIAMRHIAKGIQYVVTGEYREVRSPERLVFSWSWEGESTGETLVTIDFRDRSASTEVILAHAFFPNAESREQHYQGWLGCLARLAEVF